MLPDLSPSRRDLLRLCAAAVSLRRAFAWQDDAKFATGVSVVNILATVRDKNGKIVQDLSKDDFKVEEDGRPQTITYFSQESDLPLMLGLLVDTSGSQRNVLDKERQASYKFLEQVLREDKDKAFVLRFDADVELLKDLTSSRKELESALEALQAGGGPRLNRNGSNTPSQQPSPQGGSRGRGGFGGTAMYDAIFLTADEITKSQQGRKAAILLTDGVDSGSKTSLTSAIESSQRADTLVYSIYFPGNYGNGRAVSPGFGGLGGGGRRGGRGGGGGGGAPYPAGGGYTTDGKKILQRISRETGGGYYEVSGKQPIDKIFSNIEEELRHQYNLGYTSDQTSSGYRKLAVTVKRKGLTVRTRDGYYAN